MTNDPKPPRVKAADGSFVNPEPTRDAAEDLVRDVDGFGESLVFDEHGKLVSGTPSDPEAQQ